MSLIQNERTKLLANALDRASTACIAVGIFAPMVTGPSETISAVSILSSVAWLLAALVLHLTARFVLGRLQP